MVITKPNLVHLIQCTARYNVERCTYRQTDVVVVTAAEPHTTRAIIFTMHAHHMTSPLSALTQRDGAYYSTLPHSMPLANTHQTMTGFTTAQLHRALINLGHCILERKVFFPILVLFSASSSTALHRKRYQTSVNNRK